MSSVERSGKGMGIGIGGALVISGVIIAVIWSVVIGIIVAVIGLVAFGGFVRGKWSEASHDVALLLDIDGTLVDSAYLHAIAWQRACSAGGFDVPAYRIHRLIGMGGDQFVTALLGEAAERERGDELRLAWQENY